MVAMSTSEEHAVELPPSDSAWARLLAKAERDTAKLLRGAPAEADVRAWAASAGIELDKEGG
jgi:hypothetical protein